jgi:hypothetical protein
MTFWVYIITYRKPGRRPHYIGSTGNLAQRMGQHFGPGNWFESPDEWRVDAFPYATRAEAEAAEAKAQDFYWVKHRSIARWGNQQVRDIWYAERDAGIPHSVELPPLFGGEVKVRFHRSRLTFTPKDGIFKA